MYTKVASIGCNEGEPEKDPLYHIYKRFVISIINKNMHNTQSEFIVLD
jgi:hypothetical protein